MILIEKASVLAALLSLFTQVHAAVQVEQLDYDSLVINDCSQSALTIGATQAAVMTQIEKLPKQAVSIINDSILLTTLPSLNIGAQEQNYRTYSLIDKKISFNSNRKGDFVLSYAWQDTRFEWFNAYNSNQGQLVPSPYLALTRYQKQTLALASITTYNNQQLISALDDDFIVQRSPLILFAYLTEPLTKQATDKFKQLGIQLHLQDNLIIASKAIDVCDSGQWVNSNGHQIAWIQIDD
ncbi:hypothetical protein [Agarivorans litoreus]|uniref:hypothetical protein n=1 Tax=Agarivorans litoreus TaxID=1510455 RepID=UPI001C7D9DF3|nr:hypothetical protein [Agarivorans litoreus]